jgi:voltage-gated potassium channel
VVALDLRDHAVVRDYAPGRSEQVVAELTAEGRCEVALCAWRDVAQ